MPSFTSLFMKWCQLLESAVCTCQWRSINLTPGGRGTFFGLLHLHYCTKQINHGGVCCMRNGAQVCCWLHRALLSEPA